MTTPIQSGIHLAKRARYVVLFSIIATACGGGGGNTTGGSGGTLPLLGNYTGNTAWQSGEASRQDASQPFTFLAYGDSRATIGTVGGTACNDNAVHIRLVERMKNEPASFVFHLGDMVSGGRATNTSVSNTNWVEDGHCTGTNNYGSLKKMIAPLQSKTPATGLPTYFFPVVGNHDDGWGSDSIQSEWWYPDGFNNGFCDVFSANSLVVNHTTQPYFSKKQSQSFTDNEFYRLACSTDRTQRQIYPAYMYYSFNFRNSHFVVLRVNSDYFDLEECGNCSGDKINYDHYYNIHQLDWLRADLARASLDPAIQNIFVFLHAPIFTTSSAHQAVKSWRVLTPEFTKHKVRMVFSGHNHVYERTVPVHATAASGGDPALARDDVNGTVYVVTGGGGSPLASVGDRVNSFVEQKLSQFHYVKISVNGASVSLQAVDIDGRVIDTISR